MVCGRRVRAGALWRNFPPASLRRQRLRSVGVLVVLASPALYFQRAMSSTASHILFLTPDGWVRDLYWMTQGNRPGEERRPAAALAEWRLTRDDVWIRSWTKPHISESLIRALLREFPCSESGVL